MLDASKWHGLIYRNKDGGKFELNDRATLYGAVVARSITKIGGGTNSGGPMEFHVLGQAAFCIVQ